jgi:hypothetical protein
MGRKATVEKLPDDQYRFVISLLMDGRTDREVEQLFEAEFPGSRVPNSSLANWRKIGGSELVERYKVTRYLARTVAEELKTSGINLDEDRYKQVIDDIESQLLVKTRELVMKDPLKLLEARQFDESLRIKRENLEFKREQLALERQKLLGAATDPVKQGTEFMTELFDYAKDDPDGVRFLKKHTRPFIEHLQHKYAEAQG